MKGEVKDGFKFFWVIVFMFVPVLGCHAQNSLAPLAPLATEKKAEVDDNFSWDFGKVKEGEVLKHDFVLKNESPKTLQINEVTTSCGCTVSEVKKKTLLPGESTAVEVSFKSKGYSGPVQQYVYVNTDSLDNPVIKYIIKAVVAK